MCDTFEQKSIKTEQLGKVYALKCSNIHGAIYAVNYPYKILKQLSTTQTESQKDIFAKIFDTVINKYKKEIRNGQTVDDLKRLKRKHIQIVYAKTNPEDINPDYKTIIRRGRNWYAIYLQHNNVGKKLLIGCDGKRKADSIDINTDDEHIQNIPKSNPEKPKSNPEKPKSNPEKPKSNPEKPKSNPKKPKSNPEKPKSNPEKPKSNPEKPNSKQNKSTNNNKSMKKLYKGGSSIYSDNVSLDSEEYYIKSHAEEYIKSREQIRKYLRRVYLGAIIYENDIYLETHLGFGGLSQAKNQVEFLDNVRRESEEAMLKSVLPVARAQSVLPVASPWHVQQGVRVNGGGNDENYKLKISTEIRHDFQSVLDPEIYKKIIQTFAINPLSEDNYVRTVIKNILKDDSFCFDKFKMKNVNDEDSSHKLVHTIGIEQFEKLRTEYSPDMHMNHDVVNEFLSHGQRNFTKKYSLPRIMDPITKDKKTNNEDILFVFQVEDGESRVESDRKTINAPKDLKLMTDITQLFFKNIGYNAKFEFSKIEYKNEQIYFTIQEKDYPNNTVSIKQGHFSIATVVRIIHELNPKRQTRRLKLKRGGDSNTKKRPRSISEKLDDEIEELYYESEELYDLKKLSSWISPVVQGYPPVDTKLHCMISAILFKSLGDYLQIYIAKEVVNDLQKCFLITTKDRIAIATAIEQHTPCIFESKSISNNLFINNEVDDENDDKSREELKLENTVMFIGDLNSKTDFDDKEIEFIEKVYNKARSRNTLYFGIVVEKNVERDIFPPEKINKENMKIFIAERNIKSVSEYMTLLNMLTYVVYKSVYENKEEELFSFREESMNDIQNINFNNVGLNQFQEPIDDIKKKIDMADSSVFIKICRFVIQLKEKKFINENGVEIILTRLFESSKQINDNLDKFQSYYYDYKLKVNQINIEVENLGTYIRAIPGNVSILKNLKEYNQYITYLDGLYDVLEPFYILETFR